MPDLSAYINFTVRFDYTQNKFVLTDTGTYPGGVANNLIGIFDITHPDQIREDGAWATPDISWSGSALTAGLRDLRRNAQNKPQCGTYTFKYTIDHPSYTPTVLTKTVNFQYVPVTGVITKSFDVFTPQLRALDNVNYAISGYTIASTVRSWVATVGTVGTVTGATATLDLAIAGVYYDAAYNIALSTTLVYNNSNDTWVSIKDVVASTLNTQANTPPDTCSLLAYLNTIKQRADDLAASCHPYEVAKKAYEYAANLYFHILERLKAGSTTGVIDSVNEFLTIYYNAAPAYVNTNTAIIPYVFCYAVTAGDVTKFFVTMSTTAPSYTNALFSGKSILMTANEGVVLRDTDISLTGSTVSKTNVGDEFVAGTWYLFLLKES